MPISLRTKQTEEAYQRHLKLLDKDYCPFCDGRRIRTKKEVFKHWFIIENRFPYDQIFEVSDMLILKRHTSNEWDLTVTEFIELQEIRRDIISGTDYDLIQENVSARKSVPPHLHYHLLRFIK